jgi:PAS domain S-box-containing protein
MTPITVLHVDDDPDFVDLAATFLEAEDDRFDVETATSVGDAVARLREAAVDCIVSDYEMPGANGLEFLETVRETHPDLPFVLFTGKGSEEVASDAISAGVTDYLQKQGGTSQYAVLANRVSNAVERSRSRHALESSRQRLSLFFEESPLGVIEWDEDFTVARLNDAAEDILGYSEADLRGRTWEAIVSEADEAAVGDVVSELLDGVGGYHSVNENVTKGGETIVCEWHNRVVTDESGEVVTIFSQFQDITERRRRRTALERTNALLSTLVETLPVGVLVEDTSRNVLAVNQRLLDLFEMSGSPGTLVGADCERLAESVGDMFVDPEGFVARTNELVAERTAVFNEEVSLRDGRTFARSHRTIELPDGEGHLWVYDDVTEQVTREHQLEALNEMTRELVAATTREAVADVGVNAARDIMGLDTNAIHLYEEDRSSLVPVAATDAVYELIGEPPTFTGDGSVAWRVYREGEPLALDDVHDDPDVYNPETPLRSELYLPIDEFGILIAGSRTLEAFDDQDVVLGEILAGNVATALEQIDRTEQLRAREAELSKQNERLEEFASVVSHDLRNPLNVADGHLDLLRDECESPHVDRISKAHARMSDLIEDLLALSHQGDEIDGTEWIDPASLAAECWGNVVTDEATLVTDVTEEIEADRTRLQQLLENVFRNSVEHGSTGGRARSEEAVERRPANGQSGGATHGGSDLTVTVGTFDGGFYVEDGGPGIPVDERNRVFEAGYSTAADGTGFGLAIVERVADAHGWSVRVTDSTDGGARFELTDVSTRDRSH